MQLRTVFIIFFLWSQWQSNAQASAKDAPALLSIADSLNATGNFTQAINYYSKVGTQKSSLQIARAYNTIGNFEKSIVQYDNLIQETPNLQIARYELGKLYIKTKQFEDARKLFSVLANEDVSNPEFAYYLGEAFRELEQEASSVVAYKKAVVIDSTHLRSLFQLGKYFVVKQERNEALKYIDAGLRFYENDVTLINLKALALFNNNEYDVAMPYFERLLELGERKPHVYSKLAHCYFKDWQFEKARKTYHTLIQLDKDKPDPYFNLANVFLKENQIDSARFYINKSIEVQNPSFYREYRSLAGIARSQEDLKTALKFYQLAYKEEPDDIITYYQICSLSDQLYKDPKMKLQNYENFVSKFGTDQPYFSDMVKKRVTELKEEIHMAGN